MSQVQLYAFNSEAHAVERLPSKCEALTSNPSTAKKKSFNNIKILKNNKQKAGDIAQVVEHLPLP
jgi:hypothetical protein